METVSEVFALLRIYNKFTGDDYAYLVIYDDLSGTIKNNNNISLADFNTWAEARCVLRNLVLEAIE